MKKIFTALLAVMMLFTLAACGSTNTGGESASTSTPQSSTPQSNAPQSSTPESTAAPDSTPSESTETSQPSESVDIQPAEEESDSTRILIAYFSRAGENYNVGVIEKGNTAIIAEMIGEQTGGDLFHIETVTPYPENYRECTNVAQQELRDNARPELKATVDNFEDYDVVFLGYPNWWGDMPMAVYTFLESYDFSGKTVVPFATHEGSGLASTESSIASACSGAEVLGGLAIRGSVAQNSQAEANESVVNWLQEAGFID